MITLEQRDNAAWIVILANAFGTLPYNEHGQTMLSVLNLSIPCARLVQAGVVTAVADTNDGINDNAVADVERLARQAVARATSLYGSDGWWTDLANALLPDAGVAA